MAYTLRISVTFALMVAVLAERRVICMCIRKFALLIKSVHVLNILKRIFWPYNALFDRTFL